MEDDGLFRISEAAQHLGVSAQYIRLLENEGKIPTARRVFGCRVFSDTDVDRLRAMGVGSGHRLKPFANVVGGDE
jgi:DNA-binding transcriptional MerR regulator